MATLALAVIYLAPTHLFYGVTAFGYAVFLWLAWAGRSREREGESLSAVYALPYYFVLLNLASLKAFVSFARGEKKVVWNPRKG